MLIVMFVRIRYGFLAVALLAIAALVSGCEKKTADEENVFELFSYRVLYPYSDSLEQPYGRFLIAYNEPERKLFKYNNAYLTMEQSSGDRLYFLTGPNYLYVSETMSNVSGYDYSESFAEKEYLLPDNTADTDYGYCRIVNLVVPAPGDYVFRVKVYFPNGNKTFFTPEYKLTIEQSNGEDGTVMYCGRIEKIRD